MKFRDVFLDCATVVGSCVGVGFISGKEAQVYFGNFGNVVVFAVAFFLLCFVLRRFCAKNNCCTVVQLFRLCFGKFHAIFLALFCCCCVICMSTLLAGVESCLQTVFFFVNFPCYSFVAALFAAFFLRKGLKTLKVLNAISVVLTCLFLVFSCIFLRGSTNTEQVPTQMPLVYALFSVTTSLGVIVPLSNGSAVKNLVLSAVSAVVFGLLFVVALIVSDFSLPMPLLGRSNNVVFNIFSAIAVFVGVVCGVTANATPIFQCVSDVFQDDAFCSVTLFSVAWALSLFGFDFALRFGYIAVAFFGITVIVATFLPRRTLRRSTAQPFAATQL